MARFVAFVDKRADIGDYHRDFPEHEFFFLSHRVLPRRLAAPSGGSREPACLVIDNERLPRVLEGLAREHASRPFQGIVFGSTPEIYVLDAARTAEALRLPRFLAHPEAARDKYEMRRLLSGHAACPPTRLIRSAADLERAADVGFPCVLKPRHGYGSVCVVKCHDRGRLRDEYRRMRASLAVLSREAPAALASDDMLLEPFVGGTEHTVELFVRDGRPALEIVSDKLPMVPPWFLETGDIMPGGLAPPDRELVLASARSAARALGIEQGWAHVEIKLHDGAAHVIEIAARNGGGYTREMVRLAYGIDPRKTLVDHHLGIPPVQPLRESNTVIGRNVLARGLSLAWGVRDRDRWLGHRSFREISQRIRGGLPRLVAGPPFFLRQHADVVLRVRPQPRTGARDLRGGRRHDRPAVPRTGRRRSRHPRRVPRRAAAARLAEAVVVPEPLSGRPTGGRKVASFQVGRSPVYARVARQRRAAA